jgi:hypothetical protein
MREKIVLWGRFQMPVLKVSDEQDAVCRDSAVYSLNPARRTDFAAQWAAFNELRTKS